MLGFIEDNVTFIEKGCRDAAFFFSLHRLVGERAHLLLRGCGPPDGLKAWFERYFVSRGPANALA